MASLNIDDQKKLTGLVVNENDSTCKICLQDLAKYTCPRCNIVYCSLSCYQSEKHTGCSEEFYKQCVVEELSQTKNNADDRQRVLEMLSRDLEERADDDDFAEVPEDDLAERLDGLDLDEDIGTVWQRLNTKEKEEFARMFQDGRLANLVEIWTPWWMCKENMKLVKEEVPAKSESNGQMPSILAEIPDINALLKSKPSADCKFDLVNMLFAYAYVARLHNGCHQECPVDSAQDLLQTCCVLREQKSCGSVGDAVQKCLDDIIQLSKNTKASPHRFNLNIISDVKALISGPGKGESLTFMSAALSDINVLLNAVLAIVKKELKDKKKAGEDTEQLLSLKSKAFKGEKKTLFFLGWLQRYGMGLHRILPLLQFELETKQSEAEEHAEIQKVVDENMDKLKPRNNKKETVSVNEDYTQTAATNKIVELS